MKVANFFSDLPEQLQNELFEEIIETKACRIERIVSRGQSSPRDFWYDQEQNEWIILLQGRATLEFEGMNNFVELGPGDYLNIPAHEKHRVEWTSPEEVTVWLAIHY